MEPRQNSKLAGYYSFRGFNKRNVQRRWKGKVLAALSLGHAMPRALLLCLVREAQATSPSSCKLGNAPLGPYGLSSAPPGSVIR
ncbi:hypothetical protein Q3G72_016939 [Acer saccharum]|nr:hypothetical protein Q3G72_016939 [Acer saccharum]